MRRMTSAKLMLGNYAAIPGSGPTDQVCLSCLFLVRDSCRYHCDQYCTIAKRQGRAISPQTPACRYFEKKENA